MRRDGGDQNIVAVGKGREGYMRGSFGRGLARLQLEPGDVDVLT